MLNEILLTSQWRCVNKTPLSKSKINQQNAIVRVSDKAEQSPGTQCPEQHKSRSFHTTFVSLAELVRLKDINFHVMFHRTLAAFLTRSLKTAWEWGLGWGHFQCVSVPSFLGSQSIAFAEHSYNSTFPFLFCGLLALWPHVWVASDSVGEANRTGIGKCADDWRGGYVLCLEKTGMHRNCGFHMLASKQLVYLRPYRTP